MKIVPREKLANIQTGNQYKGKNGLVDLGPNHSTLDVAELFPFHAVDIGWRPSATNIRSHLLGKQLRVGYHQNNFIKEIEVLSPDPRIPEMKLNELEFCGTNIFGKTLLEIKYMLEVEKFELTPTDVGFDLRDRSVSFYSHDYEGDLNVRLDAIVLRFI